MHNFCFWPILDGINCIIFYNQEIIWNVFYWDLKFNGLWKLFYKKFKYACQDFSNSFTMYANDECLGSITHALFIIWNIRIDQGERVQTT